MTQDFSRFALPLYVGLFDDDGGDAGGGDDAGGAGDDAGAGAGDASSAATRGGSSRRADDRQRSRTGQFASGDAIELAREVERANTRLAEVNESDKRRRLENKELKTQLASVTSQVELSNKRAIRAEVKAALVSEGVIDADVTELFLRHAGDKIKVDDQTGDIVGVTEALASYKTAKPAFFKSATDSSASGSGAGNGGGQGGDAAGDGGDDRPNSTARGASTAGTSSGTGGGSSGVLKKFSEMTPAERKQREADLAAGRY